MYGSATTYHDSPTAEGQGSFLNSMFPSYIKNDINSVIEFLSIRQQQANGIAEEMKELIHRRQSVMATLPIPNGGTFLPFTELEFGGSGLDAFQYQLSDISHHADALDAAGPPLSMTVAGQHQALAASSHVMQTSMTGTGDGSLPCGEVARHHDKRAIPPAHATSSPSSNLDYGHASEIVFGSCLPGQTLSPAAFIYTASDNRDDHTRPSPPRSEIGRPTVLSFMSGGTKHYRCECGYESARKRGVDRHLESLHHSERKYKCSCGKKFTRYDSLHRHRKRKMQKSMGSKA